MKNILYESVEIEAKKRAERIDNAFKQVMPAWQRKLILKTKSSLLERLFGYELHLFSNSNKFEIWKRGKKLYYTTY